MRSAARAFAVGLAAACAACSGAKQDGGAGGAGAGHHGAVEERAVGTTGGADAAAVVAVGAAPLAMDASRDPGVSPDAAQTSASAADAASASASASADFTPQARLLFRIAACGGTDPLPERIDPTIVERHCGLIRERIAEFRKTYFEGEGRAFFDALVPASAPRVVVYPFGGGDLLSALVAFPDATEITTVSLELAGDPRRIDTVTPRQLRASLTALRAEIGGLLSVGSNTSQNLSASQRNELPAQVSSFLMGLAAAGYEPVGMSYFRLRSDGTIEYLTDAMIDELQAAEAAAAGKKRGASKRKGGWASPNFSEAFAHVEIRYVKPGDPTVRIHRHLGWNLGDDYLADHPELIRHLEAKGAVTLLTKGASYLLWYHDFSTIRSYMLGHLAWMLSDSTGIPPAFATKANMVQETYGSFSGAFLPGAEASGRRHAAAFRALWKKNPHRALPFRFGYLDINKRAHLLVTRPGP